MVDDQKRDEPSGEPGKLPDDHSGSPPNDNSNPPPPDEQSGEPSRKPGTELVRIVRAEEAQLLQPKSHGPGFMRREVIGHMHNIFSNVATSMSSALENLPHETLEKPISKHDMKVKDLPRIFSGISAYIDTNLLAIRRNEALVPDKIDMENIRQVFLTLKLVQAKLNDIVENQEVAHPKGPMRTEPSHRMEPYIDAVDRAKQQRRISALDVGATQNDLNNRSTRNPRLAGAEKVALTAVAKDVGLFATVAAHLLGAQITGYEFVDEGHFQHHDENIQKLMATTPPQPWADAMKAQVINMPRDDMENFQIFAR